MIPASPLPSPKTPEQLARELEERARDDARWRTRRRRFLTLAIAVGAFLPAAAVSAAGGMVVGSLHDWLTSGAGLRTVAWAGATGLAPAILLAWRGLGVLSGIVLYGAGFAGFVALAGEPVAALLPLLFMLLALFIATGALVGFIVGLEEDGG